MKKSIQPSFLTELMDVNEHYHKQGMITYESELYDDSEELSTDWIINDDGANDKATKVVFDWKEDEEWFSSLPCISPYLKQNDPDAYEAAVKSLLEKL